MIRFETINATNFKSIEQKTKNTPKATDNTSITQTELLPDFKIPLAVNVPVGYTKLGVEKLYNGQEIHNYKLVNGLRVSILPMEANSTVIKTFVNTGAINEFDEERGISHFLEHMAFNGTFGDNGYKKLSTGDVFRIVGNIGGGTNASTNFALTDYYIQAPIFYDSDLEEIISIQGAMMNNLELSDSMIEKERGPVISEINMYTDFPDTIAYNLGLKNLYNFETTSKDYIAGSTKNIQNLTREDVMEYYRKNYHPANMYTTLAGEVDPDEAIKIIAKHFHTKIENPPQRHINEIKPIETTIRRDLVSPKANATHGFVMFNGPNNNNLKDQLALEFLSKTLFGSSNSKLDKHFVDTSIDMRMGMEKISTQPNDGQVVYFEFSSNEEDHKKALEMLYHELANFKPPSEESLARMKQNKLNKLDRLLKNPLSTLSLLGSSHFTTGDCSITQYKQAIESITSEDIANCVNKYLDLNKTSISIVHPEKEIKTNINFTGLRKKSILKPENVNTYTLGNNCNVATYDTNGDYKYATMSIQTAKIPEQKPGVAFVLSQILQNGSQKFSRDTVDALWTLQQASSSIYATPNAILIDLAANKKDLVDSLKLAQEIVLRPNFTQEALDIAKTNIKSKLEAHEPTATSLILENQFPDNPLDFGNKQTLANIDNITLQDVKDFHQSLIKNGCANFTFTSDKEDIKFNKRILFQASLFPRTKVQTFETEKSFSPNPNYNIVKHENNNAQADIAIGYKFKTNFNLKDEIIFKLLSNLLSKLSFNDLREQQQLAYMVEAYTSSITTDNKMLFCNILTTTEDSETKTPSYENVQKSIDGFLKLIEDLKNGNFSDEDFMSTKLGYKADLLRISDSDATKVQLLNDGLQSSYGVLESNAKYTIIDTITKDDIIKAAHYIFNNKPTIGITGSAEALNANKEYLDTLRTKI